MENTQVLAVLDSNVALPLRATKKRCPASRRQIARAGTRRSARMNPASIGDLCEDLVCTHAHSKCTTSRAPLRDAEPIAVACLCPASPCAAARAFTGTPTRTTTLLLFFKQLLAILERVPSHDLLYAVPAVCRRWRELCATKVRRFHTWSPPPPYRVLLPFKKGARAPFLDLDRKSRRSTITMHASKNAVLTLAAHLFQVAFMHKEPSGPQ